MACRKFCSKLKRSATCRACGTPRAAPCAYRPQRVTAHRFNRRMPPEPAGGRFSGTILQDIENLATLRVHHGCALPPAPLIDTDHANRGRASPITHIALQRSQEGVLALGARLGAPSVAQPDVHPAIWVARRASFDDPTRPAGVWLSNGRQTIAKGLTGNNQDSHSAIAPG